MSKIAFSDLALRNLPLPEKGQKTYWDRSLPGFGIRVSQGGAKTFVVLDPRAKVRTAETVGRYPIVKLKDAREEARRRLAQAALGGANSVRGISWDKALKQYEKEIAHLRARTRADYKRLLGRLKFKAKALSDITPADIERQLGKIKAPSEHHHAFAALRTFFGWAYRKHYVNEHPMGRMKPPPNGKPRERILTDDELAKIWKACGDGRFGRIVKVLILTGQRKGEVSQLTKDMITADRLTLPGEMVKNKRTHSIPLTPLVRELIGEGLSWGGWSKSKLALDKASGVSGWTLHDLRRTFASGLASMNVSLPTIEKLLNHVSGSFAGIVGVYQKYEFWPEMKDALEKWEARVLSLVETRPNL